MAKGLSFEAFGSVVKTCKQTLYNWEEKHPDFLDARNKGYVECKAFWENIGLNLSLGECKGNAAVWIFNMKNRFKWRDLQPDELAEKARYIELKYSVDKKSEK